MNRIRETFRNDRTLEVILVDDASNDETWRVIQELAKQDSRILGIRLARNSGQHAALLAGLRAAQNEVTITIDDDLQFRPEDIPLLLEELESGEYDVVYGVPREVKQNIGRRTSGRLIRRLLRGGLGVAEAPELSPFRALRTSLREGFGKDLGPNISIDALLSWTANKYSAVQVTHQERVSGSSNYNFLKLFRHALDIATGYSAIPLQLASAAGAVTALFGFAFLLYVILVAALAGTSVPGFRMIFAAITILCGVQLLCLGILGEYLARMHFRIMGKPTFFISETTRTPENQN